MARTITDEGKIRLEAEQVVLNHKKVCLANSDMANASDSFAVVNSDGEFEAATLFQVFESINKRLGYMTLVSFMDGLNDNPDECDAVKFLIETINEVGTKARILFDDSVDSNRQASLMGIRRIRKAKETTVVVEVGKTPEQIIAAKLASFSLKGSSVVESIEEEEEVEEVVEAPKVKAKK